MQETPFGRSWEWRQSVWLAWLLFPFGFTSFISFLYIGIRARRIKWILSSILYLIIIAVYFYINEHYDIDHVVFDTIMIIVMIAWAAAWIQAFLARREYLRIIMNQVLAQHKLIDEQRKNNEHIYRHTEGKPEAPRPLRRRDSKTNTEDTPTPLNVNKATAKQLRTLPSIDIMSATEIVSTRESKGPFISYTHFIYALNVQPHVFSKAKPWLFFTDDELPDKMDPSKQPDNERDNKDRITKRKRGRIVDY